MLTDGDNTAADLLFTLAAGGPGVTEWLHDQGITDQRVDRSTDGIIRDYLGVPHGGAYLDAMRAAVRKDPDLTRRATIPNEAFEQDPRDQATPVAMIELLERIASARALSRTSTNFILAAMRRSSRDQGLAALMPAGTVLAHRSSSIGGSLNDVGILDLPDGRKLLIAIFVKGSRQPAGLRERAIAEIGRTVRDHYVTRSGE